MPQSSFFADAPQTIFETLAGKVGKIPLLMMEDNEIFKDVILTSAKLGKITGEDNYDDVPVFRLSFDTVIDGEFVTGEDTDVQESFELDVFWTETFDSYDDRFIIDSHVSDGYYDYNDGFKCRTKGKEKMFCDDLKYVILDLNLIDTLNNHNRYNEWHQKYIQELEEKWRVEILPYLKGINQIKYLNENFIHLILGNGITLSCRLNSIYVEIENYKNHNHSKNI